MAAAAAPRDHAQGDLPEEIVFRGCSYNLDKFATEYMKNKEALINLLSGNTLIPCGITGSWSSIALSYDGTHIVACQSPGHIYTSSDSGETWTQRGHSSNWGSVASSYIGKKLVACEWDGYIYTSSDTGATWTRRGERRDWRDIASSETGDNLVACVNGGYIYTSSNSGETWTQRGHSAEWISVTSSYDGSKLCACQLMGNVYTSPDFGATWTPCKDTEMFTIIASSKDGIKLIARESRWERDDFVHISSDAGENWTKLVVDSDGAFIVTGVAISHDGNKLVVCCEKNIYISSDSGNTWTIYKQGVRAGRLSDVTLSGDGNKLCVLWYVHYKSQMLMSQTGCVPLPVPIYLGDKECVVCKRNYGDGEDYTHTPMMFSCRHVLCKYCYEQLEEPKRCPMCRVSIQDAPIEIQTDGYLGTHIPENIIWGGGYKKIRTKRA